MQFGLVRSRAAIGAYFLFLIATKLIGFDGPMSVICDVQVEVSIFIVVQKRRTNAPTPGLYPVPFAHSPIGSVTVRLTQFTRSVPGEEHVGEPIVIDVADCDPLAEAAVVETAGRSNVFERTIASVSIERVVRPVGFRLGRQRA